MEDETFPGRQALQNCLLTRYTRLCILCIQLIERRESK